MAKVDGKKMLEKKKEETRKQFSSAVNLGVLSVSLGAISLSALALAYNISSGERREGHASLLNDKVRKLSDAIDYTNLDLQDAERRAYLAEAKATLVKAWELQEDAIIRLPEGEVSHTYPIESFKSDHDRYARNVSFDNTQFAIVVFPGILSIASMVLSISYAFGTMSSKLEEYRLGHSAPPEHSV